MQFVSKERGFTLIEFVMVIALLGIIAVVVAKMFAQNLLSAQTEQNVTDALWQGQIAMQHIVKDIRTVRSPSDISANSTSQFSFTDINGNASSYLLSSNTITLNGQPLAYGISSLQFGYYDNNGNAVTTAASIHYVTITLTVTQNNTHYSLTSAVYLRDITT